jgi:hypothetical protein
VFFGGLGLSANRVLPTLPCGHSTVWSMLLVLQNPVEDAMRTAYKTIATLCRYRPPDAHIKSGGQQ